MIAQRPDMSGSSHSQVSSEFVFLDDKRSPEVSLNQAEVLKSVYKLSDPGPCRSYHLGQLFMRYLQFDAKAARLFLAECVRQLQQRLAEPLLAIHRHHIGDELLLVGNAPGQIAHETVKQRVAA